MMDRRANPLDRNDARLVVLDIEASALGKRSYPIELGVAIIEGTAKPIQTWSSLIMPTNDWETNGLWSLHSQAVHGITIERLRREGRSVDFACHRLNALLRPAVAVVTDAPMYDQAWLDRLFDSAGKEQQFVTYDFERLAGYLNAEEHRQFLHLLRRSVAPHRAGPDALRLASAVLEARLGYRPQVREIAQ